MAISYSQSEWFVPSLKDLTDSKRISTERCVWHNSKRAPKKDGAHLIKCSCIIGEQDVTTTNHLVEALRKAPVGGREYVDKLRELSSLVLCKHPHRSANAQTIFKFWMTELDNPGPTRKITRPNTCFSSPDPSSSQVKSPDALEQLGIIVGSKVNCHGRTKRADRCGNWISQSNVGRIVAISRQLGPDWRLSDTVRELLQELSGLIMCQRSHQDQAPLKLIEWVNIANQKLVPKTTPPIQQSPAPPRTPPRQSLKSSYPHRTVDGYSDVETPETRTSSPWTSPRRSLSPASNLTTPNSSSQKPRTTNSSPHHDGLPKRNVPLHSEDLLASPTPTSRQTRSMTKAKLSSRGPTKAPIAFQPYKTTSSPLEAATCLLNVIKKPLSKAQFADGFIYGYRRPGCEMLKIGMTNRTVASRMKDIESRCKYKPKVVFEIYAQHTLKVEGLVHKHLYNQRRRELCCKGCSTGHAEWFDGVTDAYATSVVKAWVRWIDLQPYNEKGFLEEEWVTQTKLFNLNTPGDTWMQWTRITIPKKNIKEEVKEEIQEEVIFDRGIKIEKFLDVLSMLGSQRGQPLTRKIKDEYFDVAATVPPQTQIPILVQ